jgi:hypothetical protein
MEIGPHDYHESCAAKRVPLFLTDTDVIRAILEQIVYCDDRNPDLDVTEARANLLSTALSCTGLRDASLDLLWSTMYSIVPLLKLFPGIHELQGKLARLTTVAPVTESWLISSRRL